VHQHANNEKEKTYNSSAYKLTNVTMETSQENHKIVKISLYFPSKKPSQKSKRVKCGIILNKNVSTLSVQNFKKLNEEITTNSYKKSKERKFKRNSIP